MSDTTRVVLPDLTVVIPTIGRPVLSACLEALRAGSAWPARVIVVDQGRQPDTAAAIGASAAAGLSVEHVVSSQRGAGAARNRGLERVDTRFVAAVDDDCVADEDWLSRMAVCLRAHPRSVVTGQVLPAGAGDSAPSLITAEEAQVYTRPLLERDVLYTGNMGVAAEVVARVGLFDEAPVLRNAAEDNEWAYRALRAGVAIRYEPNIRVRHLDWRDETQLAAVERRYARGQGGLYGLYLRRGDAFMARRVVHDIVRSLKSAVRGVVRREKSQAVRPLLALAELCIGIAAGLLTPRRRPPDGG